MKYHHYPLYQQNIRIERFPAFSKVKHIGHNSFFFFTKKFSPKGNISLERTVIVYPTPSFLSQKIDWGKISQISLISRQKYQESSKYWPSRSLNLKGIPGQKWFQIDDLRQWVHRAANFISTKIIHRENQTERLGAYQAFRNGIGDCDEFTDMFMTLARLRAVPCRRLTGYFIRENGNKVENHAWNEIFSPGLEWITIDVALNNLGDHTINYIILKVEEFNPALPDYQIQTKHTRTVHYRWERPPPIITPVI